MVHGVLYCQLGGQLDTGKMFGVSFGKLLYTYFKDTIGLSGISGLGI